MSVVPKVSVIVPVYKVEPFIERCAHSLFNQTMVDIEFIFVDDGTPDKSIEVLMDVLKKYPDRIDSVKILGDHKNHGLPHARNVGLAEANGQYVIFCDSDDYVDHTMYEKLYNTACDADADIVISGIYRESSSSIASELYDSRYLEDDKDALLNCKVPLRGVYVGVWNKLVKKSLYNEIGSGFVESLSMWEDSAVSMRLRYVSHKTIVVNEPLYHYCMNNPNSITKGSLEKKIDDQIHCAQFLTDWFESKGVGLNDSGLIPYLQFEAKVKLFTPLHNYKAWSETFPLCIKYLNKFRKFYSPFFIIQFKFVNRCGRFASMSLGCMIKMKHFLSKI